MQDQNQTAAHFVLRTDRLQKKLRLSLVETGNLVGVSKAMLFAYRSGSSPISDKVWRKLEEAEVRNGLQEYPETKDRGAAEPRIEESKPLRSEPPSFTEYLLMLRGLREEAEKLGGGNVDKTMEVFDRMLETWQKTLTAYHQPPESELTQAATLRKIAEVRAQMAAEDEAARQGSERKHG